MVNHTPTSHYDKNCINVKIYHRQSWLAMFILGFIVFILEFMLHGFIIFMPCVCDYYFINMKINHGQTFDCDKDSLDMKINHGQP